MSGAPRPALSRLFILILALGAGLRLVRYASDRSLNGDEASLALNILDRSWHELRLPLADEQMAPLGFLWLEKLSAVALGASSYALRLVPLFGGLGSLAAFAALTRGVLGERDALLAMTLFAFNEPLVHYSSEVKQYSTDVLVSLLVTLAALRARGRGLFGLGMSGAGGLLLSHPAVFTNAGSAVAEGFRMWRERIPRKAGLPLVVAAWASALALHLSLAPGQWAAASKLRGFWAFGFMPWPPARDLLWFPRTFFGAFQEPVGLAWPGLGAAAFVAGIVALVRRDGYLLVLLLAPAAAVALAAVLHVFPFPTSLPGASPMLSRLVLFLTPQLTLVVAAGGELLRQGLEPWRRRVVWLVAVLLAASPVWVSSRKAFHPPKPQDLRPIVAHMASHGRPGDRVLLLEWSASAFEFHARESRPGRQLLTTMRRTVVVPHGSRASYSQLLAGFPDGTRLWLVFTHHPEWHSEEDESRLLELLRERARLLTNERAVGASGHLFCVGPDSCG